LAGELFDGHLFVHERFDQAPYDGSWLWLVENLRTGEAELWRSCDLTRIVRRAQKINKCKYGGYRAYADPEACKPCGWYYDDLKRARQRLDEIRTAQPTHYCVVVTDTDEEGTVTERCGRVAPNRYYGTDSEGVRYEMWLCADHLPFMAKVDWNKRKYY